MNKDEFLNSVENKLHHGIAIVSQSTIQARVYAQGKAWKTKCFPFGKYAEACAWQEATTIERDQLNLSFKNKQKGKLKRKTQSNNTSGRTGVYIYKVPRQYGFCKYYIAFWTIDGKTRKKHFSVNKLGEKQARQKAWAWREKIEKIVQKVNESLNNTFDSKKINKAIAKEIKALSKE